MPLGSEHLAGGGWSKGPGVNANEPDRSAGPPGEGGHNLAEIRPDGTFCFTAWVADNPA